ncbi:MAG: tyrosine-type recombinase/integrase [Smithella sp.]
MKKLNKFFGSMPRCSLCCQQLFSEKALLVFDWWFGICGITPNNGIPIIRLVSAAFLKSLCKRAGIRPSGFHSLRRYVVSMLADIHKVSAKTIQRILKHKSLQTTKRYIYNLNPDLSGVMDLLDVTLIESTTKEKSELGIILTR